MSGVAEQRVHESRTRETEQDRKQFRTLPTPLPVSPLSACGRGSSSELFVKTPGSSSGQMEYNRRNPCLTHFPPSP